MLRMKTGFLALLILLLTVPAFSQKDTISKSFRVAIFTPLYLDSAFDLTASYRYGKTFPRFFNAGLEFYEGVQLALDSLQQEGARLTVYVYDTKSSRPRFQDYIKSDSLQKVDLILGHVTANEAKLLADTAAKKIFPSLM